MSAKVQLPPLTTMLEQQKLSAWQTFSEQQPVASGRLNEQQQALFQSACALSDFILRSAQQAPDLVVEVFQQLTALPIEFPNYQQALTEKLALCSSEAELHRVLRRFRLQEMVRLAAMDLLSLIPLTDSLRQLSLLADQLILSALAWLSDFCSKQWGTPTNSESKPLPLLIYGMGKLGGFELNFSSDIDLIFTYPEDGETQGARRSISNQQFFTRLAQKLISSLHQVTADGFVYRVDMRLRPFGDSGPIVLSFSAMESYYQTQGRDWERYAMLKARLLGSSDYHHELDALLKPFIFRRYIDFSVIESLRRMKNMIAQEVRRKQLEYNIKLGAGGIREIEFVVQVFQLIRGGRAPHLQERNLLTVLPLLVEHGEIPADSGQALQDSYCFLRRVENLIQAFDDRQTQTLPNNELDQHRLLAVLNASSGIEPLTRWQEFLALLNGKMATVHQHFDQLIGTDSPHQQQGDDHWQALWDALADNRWDVQTCQEWIEQVCPNWPADQLAKTLYDFSRHLQKKTVGERGQQVVNQLLPIILGHFQHTNISTDALAKVLMIIEKILTRTAYLELLRENEGALLHLLKLCQASSWIAEHIAKYPILLDELIDPQFLHNPPQLSAYSVELQEQLMRIPEDDLEAQMLMLRQFKQVQQLRIATADVSGALPLMKVSDHLTALAETIIAEVINIAWQYVSERFGIPEALEGCDDKGFAVIGYGKTGGIELGYGSDLDLVFVHNLPFDQQTNGDKAIPASQFYIKLAQRIMHIFNTRMLNGMLYELDLRLRPSGNSGLLVVNIDTYQQYLANDAWIWELQALVRARLVYGSESLLARFNDIRQGILAQPRAQEELATEVKKMRTKMQQHLDKSAQPLVDIKQGAGGLVDIEFLAQYLVLSYSHQYPAVARYSDNIRMFEQLAANKLITELEAKQLIECYCQLRNFGHLATLQQQESLMHQQEFAPYQQQVTEIYRRYLNAG